MIHNEFKKSGRAIVDLIAEYWDTIEERRVATNFSREELFEQFSDTITSTGDGASFVENEIRPLLDQTMAMAHPLYLGLVNSTPLPSAVLGDLLVSALDNNAGASHQGPAQAAAEHEVVRWLNQALGYEGSGLILPGGSLASMQGIQFAKARHFPAWHADGPMSVTSLPRIYTSDSVHFSAIRAATTLGFGLSSVGIIESKGRGQIEIEKLEQQILTDLESGHQPFCIVASAGTTGTGAVDELDLVADICEKYDLWLHVDACYGGGVAISQTYRQLLKGIHRADSIAIDLHKWFFMPLTAGICLTKHPEIATELFKVDATYIPDDDYIETYSRGFPTSRRSTGLAFWLAMRISGTQVISDAVDRNIEQSRQLENGLARHGFRVLSHGQLSIACCRWEPNELNGDALDALQVQIADQVCQSGSAWFATTVHKGETWLRFNPVNLNTRSHHIDQLVQVVFEAAVDCANPQSVAE